MNEVESLKFYRSMVCECIQKDKEEIKALQQRKKEYDRKLREKNKYSRYDSIPYSFLPLFFSWILKNIFQLLLGTNSFLYALFDVLTWVLLLAFIIFSIMTWIEIYKRKRE